MCPRRRRSAPHGNRLSSEACDWPPGARLGPYEILAPLGAGGMGEVYKARDTRLDRSVALKILSLDTSTSPEARQRFEREARTISQLSHPHICALFDVGEAANPESPVPHPYLVMELLEGETLADRIAGGSLPLELTLRYGVQIADALDRAHRHGIVHRDLKPSNVMITKAGVKLLDFGLAKAFQPVIAPDGVSAIETTPIPGELTGEGTFLGTLQYMAPEQLGGRAADVRSDIFALGTLLFEMATGRKAFAGGSSVAIAAAVLRDQTPALSSVRPDAPPLLDRLIRVCLEKDPDARWQSAHDVAVQLASLQDVRISGAATAVPAVRRRFRAIAPWVIAAAASAAALVVALRSREPIAPGTVRFLVGAPSGNSFANNADSVSYAVSPDGSQLAFIAVDDDRQSRLWLRPLSAVDARPVAGTEGADDVFWSLDGRSLAFFAGSKLKRVDAAGGAVVPICDAPVGMGKTGTWGRDGAVLFATRLGNAIYRTSTAGGAPVAEIKTDQDPVGTRIGLPAFLPDGRRFLYLSKPPRGGGSLMIAGPGQAPRVLMSLDSNAQYVDPGLLVFAREGTLLGQRFDLEAGRLSGEPFSIANPLWYLLDTGRGDFSVSRSGALAYRSRSGVARLAWVDRTGKTVGVVGAPSGYTKSFLAADGRTVALDRRRPDIGRLDIWAIDLARGVETRVTTDLDTSLSPVLFPDASSVIFGSTKRSPAPNLVRKDLTTGADAFLLPFSRLLQHAEDVSPDGSRLLFSQWNDSGSVDLWSLPLTGNRAPSVFVKSLGGFAEARFSPDGKFVAYLSSDSGRSEVTVEPFLTRGVPTQVSIGGARLSRWSRDSHELFYLGSDGRLMAVAIQTTPELRIGAATPLFSVPVDHAWATFDVAPDGKRFLALVPEVSVTQQPLTVVLNATPEWLKQ
jgi:eukaryotic-like serine/threonine-protein kinase